MKKLCNKCSVVKEISLFSKRKISKDGYRNDCKECSGKYKKKWNEVNYLENKLDINQRSLTWAKNNPEKVKNNSKKHRDKSDKEKTKEFMKEYRKVNKEKLSIKRKIYLENNPDMKSKFYSNRYKNMSNLQRLKNLMRTSLNKEFRRGGYIKDSKSNIIIGCSYEYLLSYIESKFESWMNWGNHGKYNGELNYGWDIDHIIPLSSVNTENDIFNLCHYSNLQPLCSKVNRDIKRDRLDFI